MNDVGTCPYCNEDFTAPPYGRGLNCVHCGGKIDVLPEPEIWLETPFGTIGVSNLGKLTNLLKEG